MANYHVLEGSNAGDSYRVVFHVSVPDELNKTGNKNIRTALSEDSSINKTSVIPGVEVTEQTDLTNGVLYEHVETFSTHSEHTLASERSRLDARYTELTTSVANALRRRYAFWKFERNVP